MDGLLDIRHDALHGSARSEAALWPRAYEVRDILLLTLALAVAVTVALLSLDALGWLPGPALEFPALGQLGLVG